MRPSVAITVTALGTLATLAACSFTTDNSDRLSVENDLPVPISVTIGQSGASDLVPAHTTHRLARDGFDSLTWRGGFNFSNTLGYQRTIPISNTDRVAIDLHPTPDTTVFVLEVSNRSAGPRAVLLFTGGLGVCYTGIGQSAADEFTPVSLSLLGPTNSLQVYSGNTCSGSFTTLPNAALLAEYNPTTGVIQVAVP